LPTSPRSLRGALFRSRSRVAIRRGPEPRKASVAPMSSTLSETLVSNSLSRRERRSREVTYWPSLPANGEVLMVKTIVRVGSSILSGSRGAGLARSVIVSPIWMPSTPAMATMSPAFTSSASSRSRPRKVKSLVIFVGRILPSSFAMPTSVAANKCSLENARDGDTA